MGVTKKTSQKKLSLINRMMGVTEEDIELEEYGSEVETDEESTAALGKQKHGVSIDLIDQGDLFLFRACIPGVSINDLDITVTRELVSVEAETSTEFIESGDNYFHQEIETGLFSRSVLLPEEIDPEEVKAESRDGVVTIRLPKLDKKKKMRVEVKKR